MNLRYRSGVSPDDLAVGDCTVRGATGDGVRWWMLWFHVERETDRQPETFAVPVIPNGSFTETGPGGRSWGLNRAGPGVWQVSPSIDVWSDEDGRRQRAGLPRQDPSLWHQTPAIVEVPDGERWASG